jgi:Mrp family chromosome partitioning ATPase
LSVNVQGAGGPGVVGNGATGAGIVGSGNIQTLRNQENALNKLLRNAQEELDELGRDNIALKDVVNKEADIHRRSAETKQRLEELKVEAAGTGRIDVISYGDRPVLETHKGNVIALAGGVAGAALAVGGMVLFELVNRRMRGIQDVQTGGDASTRLKVLGAVPMLGDDTPESDHTAAAYAVHKIRATLQIDAARFGRKVLAVTSPASGNGKTSVVIALGMSFASSRSRILLIDGDLIGGGLTSRLNGRVQRNIVDILRRCTIVTEKQLTHAAKIANHNTSRFLQALVDLKYVDRETITEAVAIHKASDIGVLEALAGEPLGTCVAQTRWPNLFILPRGAATPADAAELSPMAFRQLLHQARNLFDMVLIDTGPIFGSIEATMAASEADGTILVVTKGESAGAVCRAVKDLNMLGAKTIGAIFNRAKPKDMIFGGFSASSYQSQAFSPSAARSNIGHGPIANAIISASSAAHEIPDIENDGSL